MTILLLVLLCGSLLVASGVDVAQSSRILCVVVVQVAAGAALWRLARGATPSHVTELVGMGLALGTLTSLLSSQLLLSTPLAGTAWLLPTAAVAAALAVPKVRRRFRSGSTIPNGSDEVGTIALGVGTGLVFLWYFWRKHPLRWDGWWAYYVDIPYHEALATSLATWGPSDNILVAGKPIRYHWFAHAWAGMTTNASGAGSFVVITRLVPLAALVGTICLTWAWSRRLSNLRAVPFLAVLVTTLGMDVGRGPAPLTFLENLSLSPSMAMAMLWLLGAALVLTEHFAGRLARPEALLFLLAVGCAGGKVSDAAVLVGGVGLAALASLFTRRCRQRVWIDLAVVGADRVVANGDAANKIGTYGVAVLARAHQLPFYFVAPTSTVDLSIPDGSQIPIEERKSEEVTSFRGVQTAPDGTHVANPAFDVTPARLITAIVTENGIVRAPFSEGLRAAVAAQSTTPIQPAVR